MRKLSKIATGREEEMVRPTSDATGYIRDGSKTEVPGLAARLFYPQVQISSACANMPV
jgi:hypothetical protein